MKTGPEEEEEDGGDATTEEQTEIETAGDEPSGGTESDPETDPAPKS